MDRARLEQVVATMPDEVDIETFIDRLLLLQKLEIAESQIAAGDVISHEVVKRQLAQWT